MLRWLQENGPMEQSASDLAWQLAQNLTDPRARTCYALVNACDAFRHIGISRPRLEQLVREAERSARIEALPRRAAEEILLIAKSNLNLDQDERLSWLRQADKIVSYASRNERGDWQADTRDRQRISGWVSIVALNHQIAPPGVTQWASDWLRTASLMPSMLYAASFDVLNMVRFGHTGPARRFTRRIVAARNGAPYWGSTDLSLTLRILINLTEAGTIDARSDELQNSHDWVMACLRDSGLGTRPLALGVEYLSLVGIRGASRRDEIEDILINYEQRRCTNCGFPLVEGSPSIFADRRTSEPLRPPSVIQTIHVYGNRPKIGLTGSGSVFEQATNALELEETRRLLQELEQAILRIEAPERERDGFLETVHHVQVELEEPRPRASRLLAAWGAVSTFATLEGAWQGWERVQRISVDLAPRIQSLIEALNQST